MATSLFISYSRADMQDTDWLARLRMYLTPFRRSGAIDVWDDTRIAPGSQWKDEIAQALGAAGAAVLLVGPGFLASDFVIDHELPPLLQSARVRGVPLFPLVVGFCAYSASDLHEHQTFNPADHPLESLTRSEQNRILNALAMAIDKSARRGLSQGREHSSNPRDLYQRVQTIQRHLADAGTAFVAQCRRRNALVAAIERRLKFKNNLEYEKFFLTYYSQLIEVERFEFDQIRAMTEGPLQTANRKILEIIENEPEVLDIAPQMMGLRQHLVFWLNKYDKVFAVVPAMCLLYTGVEDGVPFPPKIDDAIAKWLRTNKR